MKTYALLLACLTLTLGTTLYGQSTGGAGSSGATGGTGAGAPTQPRVTPPPVGTPQRPLNPGVVDPRTGTASPGNVGTPGRPATGSTIGPGANTGAIGGVGPGIGGTGGTLDPAGNTAVGNTPGLPGTPQPPGTTPNTPASLQTGVTTQPGVGIGETGTGTPADMVFAQRVRGQLLNNLSVAAARPGTTPGARATALTPQSLAHVQINVNNGIVTLQGAVKSEAERRLLEDQIRRMNGVQAIVNNLTVAPAAPQAGQAPAGQTGNPGVGGTGTPVPR